MSANYAAAHSLPQAGAACVSSTTHAPQRHRSPRDPHRLRLALGAAEGWAIPGKVADPIIHDLCPRRPRTLRHPARPSSPTVTSTAPPAPKRCWELSPLTHGRPAQLEHETNCMIYTWSMAQRASADGVDLIHGGGHQLQHWSRS